MEVGANGSTYLHLNFKSHRNTEQSSVLPIVSESSEDVGFAGLHFISKKFSVFEE